MDLQTILQALVLGLIEGLTEFIPVSSTAHLLLAEKAMGLDGEAFWKTFTVMIQLGAILAVVLVYFQRLWKVVLDLPRDPGARRFALSVIIACIPAVLAGAVLKSKIEAAFDNTQLICWSLIIGGVVLLAIDRIAPHPSDESAMKLPLWKSALIGVAQVASLFPGVSRSGSTIVAAMLLKVEKRAAAEFTFFLAIPIMLGAFLKDLWDEKDNLSADNALIIGIGFAASFVFGLIVIRTMLGFVQKRGFWVFGVWRILVGGLGLAFLNGLIPALG
jgi:undecaprenyl-diphosphatase